MPDYLKEQPGQRQEVAQTNTTQVVEAPGTQLTAVANSVSQPAVLSQPPTKTTVSVTSEPAGAEIYVDGKFDSSTPSKLLLAPGEHTIRVTRPGFIPWERKITLEIGAEKTLNALLEKETSNVKAVPK